MKNTVTILLRNRPDALVRLTGVLYRRGCVVESLSVAPDSQPGHARVTAVITGQPAAEQIICQVRKLIDVVAAEIVADVPVRAALLGLRRSAHRPAAFARYKAQSSTEATGSSLR